MWPRHKRHNAICVHGQPGTVQARIRGRTPVVYGIAHVLHQKAALQIGPSHFAAAVLRSGPAGGSAHRPLHSTSSIFHELLAALVPARP